MRAGLLTFGLFCLLTGCDSGSPAQPPLRAVLIAGDEEYRSEEALPLLAQLLETQGFRCTVLFSKNPETGAVDPRDTVHTPGLEALQSADLVVLFTRFRAWPEADRVHLARALALGVPMIGLRTASHAFAYPPEAPAGARHWSWDAADPPGGFGGQWFGDTWVAHHGAHGSESTRALPDPAAAAAGHPVLRGFTGAWGPTDVYAFHPLPADCVVLARGQVLAGMTPDAEPVADGRNEPLMPLAWARELPHPSGIPQRVFYSSMGASQDFADPGLQRLVVQACLWAVHREARIPPAGVTLPAVPDYAPTPFGFR